MGITFVGSIVSLDIWAKNTLFGTWELKIQVGDGLYINEENFYNCHSTDYMITLWHRMHLKTSSGGSKMSSTFTISYLRGRRNFIPLISWMVYKQ